METKNGNPNPIEALCVRLYADVVAKCHRLGVRLDDQQAVARCVKDEIKAFIGGDEYAAERGVLANGGGMYQVVWASVVAGAVKRIADLQRQEAAK